MMAAWLERPETNYVSVGDAQVAYQVVGDGPVDVVFCYSLGGQVDQWWQIPQTAEYLASMAAVSRLIVFDRRGSGASDPLPMGVVPTWEELAEDLTAVLDAVGSAVTSMVVALETGPIAILFAAMHPERVRSLVLLNTTARFMFAPEYPQGLPPESVDAIVELLAQSWGTEELSRLVVPSLARDHEFTTSFARMMRASATPRTAAAQFDYFLRNIDVRHVLHLVRTPTIVLHVTESPFLPLVFGQYLAKHIAGAQLVEVPGGDLIVGMFVGADAEERTADITEFLTGERPVSEVERVLTTVLFTDIVGSTEHASSLGAKSWRALLDAHDRVVREQLRKSNGREIKTLGDGFVASFDGPARAIRCAAAIQNATKALGVDIRAGLHTGECDVRGDDLGGLAVHIAARVGSLAGPGEVLVSRTVTDLVTGSGIEFKDRGEHELKGVPGSWRLFAVID